MKNDNRVTDYSSNGECSRCCHCCGPLLPITMTEANRMKKRYKEDEEVRKVVAKNTYIERDHTKHTAVNLCCPFADLENHRCSIYEDRPEVCKVFKCHNYNSNDIKTCENKAYYNKIRYDENFNPISSGSNFMTIFKLLGFGELHNVYILYHFKDMIDEACMSGIIQYQSTMNYLDKLCEFDKPTLNKAFDTYAHCYDTNKTNIS